MLHLAYLRSFCFSVRHWHKIRLQLRQMTIQEIRLVLFLEIITIPIHITNNPPYIHCLLFLPAFAHSLVAKPERFATIMDPASKMAKPSRYRCRYN